MGTMDSLTLNDAEISGPDRLSNVCKAWFLEIAGLTCELFLPNEQYQLLVFVFEVQKETDIVTKK